MMINDFKELNNAVKASLNIAEVLPSSCNLDAKGNGLCPFHNDRRKGNFKVRFDTNMYECFACGERGHAIGLIQKERGITDYVELVYTLGYELGLICKEEMEKKRIMPKVREFATLNFKGIQRVNIQATEDKIAKAEKYRAKMEKRSQLTDSEVELYDTAYRALAFYCGLDEDDLEHLIIERCVGSSKLQDFFSLRNLTEKKVVAKTVSFLKRKGYTEEDILKVPGFYKTKTGSISLAGFYTRGIGLKIRNAKGKVIGVQVRTNNPEKKYIWLSSTAYEGTASGTPCAVEYTTSMVEEGSLNIKESLKSCSKNSIFITEGKFKAVSLAKELGAVSIGISGIRNWENKVKREVSTLTDIKQFNNVVLYPDADCCYNTEIFNCFKELAEKELEEFNLPVYVAYWNIKLGKGVDDVINNGDESEIRYMTLEKFSKKYKEFENIINEKYSSVIKEQQEEKTEVFNKVFSL